MFCLIGYACGLLADDSSADAAEQGHTALFEIVVTAAAAVCGEALAALLGVMLSDPRVTWPAIRNVLPAAVAYDVLLCPFVLYAVAAALRLAGARGEGRRAGWSASQARAPVPGANQGAIRQLAGRNSLRLSDRDKGPGAIGGLRGPGPAGRWPGVSLGSSWAGPGRGPRRPHTGRGTARARPRSGSAAGAGRACSAVRCSAAPAPAAPRCAAPRWVARRCAARRCAVPGCAVPGWAVPGCAVPGCAVPGWAAPGSAARAWAGPCSAVRCSAAPPPRWAAVLRSAARRPSSAGRLSSAGGLSRPFVAPTAPGQPDGFRGRRAGRACS